MSWWLSELFVVGFFLTVGGVVLAAVSTVIIHQYECGIVMTFGRFSGMRGAGIRFVVPIIQQMFRVDIRQKVADIPAQDIITKDNVLVTINGVVYYQINDAKRAVLDTQHYDKATTEMAQAMLRAAVGNADLDDLSDTQRMGSVIRDLLAEKTPSWGVRTLEVEIKEIQVDPQMVQSISRQAMAERDRRARVVEAEGELQAAGTTAEAARTLMETPGAFTLRYINALKTVSANPSATIVFPMPDVMGGLTGEAAGTARQNAMPDVDPIQAGILAGSTRTAEALTAVKNEVTDIHHNVRSLEAHAERAANGASDE